MSAHRFFKTLLPRFSWWALSVPIYIKILGIGMLVTVFFGGVAFYQIQAGLLRTHYQIHGETAFSLATSVALSLEPILSTNDTAAFDHELDRTMEAFPDVRYVVVQDAQGDILSHGVTFPSEAPPDLVPRGADLCGSCHPSLSPKEIPTDLLEIPPRPVLPAGKLRAYTRGSGLILEVTVSIPGPEGAIVRLGIGDKIIAREVTSITRSLFLVLGLCVVVGLSLALVLAYIIVRPIHNLVQAANAIREGDFAARATIFSQDEIGSMALAFNQMAEGLERYKCEVLEKEAARVSLIGQIVQAQEDERKSVARELHDQLGQSLSSTLLTIESSCGDCLFHSEHCDKIKADIRGMIDDVRRLAWDVRPPILDDYGLDLALRRYVEETSERASLPIDYQCVNPADSERLPAQIEVALYRIAQEAITNVVRHAGASQISMILLRQTDEVSLIVEDDGNGFEMDSVDQEGHRPLGLMGMRERASLVGGEFVMASIPGKGVTIRVRIGLDKEGHANQDSDSG